MWHVEPVSSASNSRSQCVENAIIRRANFCRSSRSLFVGRRDDLGEGQIASAVCCCAGDAADFHFEGSGQNLTSSVAAGAFALPRAVWACACLKGHPLASAARMQVQVQVRLALLPETSLHKAI